MEEKSKLTTLDLSKTKPMKAKSSGRNTISISIVNTPSNGKRIKFSKSFMEQLGNPTEVQFRIHEDKIIVGNNLDKDEKTYKLSKSSFGTLYNSSIVANFTEILLLDFSAVTSTSIHNIDFIETAIESGETVLVAVISKN